MLKPVEVLRVLFLDVACHPLGYQDVARGMIDRCHACPREVFRTAVHILANSIICLHNHPSMSCFPSEEEVDVTRRLSHAGDVLGIYLLDHIIISSEGDFYSFQENKMLDSHYDRLLAGLGKGVKRPPRG